MAMLINKPLDSGSLIPQSLHCHHLVGFVEYEDPDHLGIKDPAATTQHVDHRTRCSDQNMFLDLLVPGP